MVLHQGGHLNNLARRWIIWPIQNDSNNLKNGWNLGTWVLIWEYSARAIHWIERWQGFYVFQISLHPFTLDESIFNMCRYRKALYLPLLVFQSLPSIYWLYLMQRYWRRLYYIPWLWLWLIAFFQYLQHIIDQMLLLKHWSLRIYCITVII